ncbi:Hypothetical protein POVR1_LOCUS192 [uncultured virus]|nr:Hypothetical protein POVR1_LOCUS192 [uncultured virus]
MFLFSSCDRYVDYKIVSSANHGSDTMINYIRLKPPSFYASTEHALAEISHGTLRCGEPREAILESLIDVDVVNQHDFIPDVRIGLQVLFRALETRRSFLGLPVDWSKTRALGRFERILQSFNDPDHVIAKYLYLYSQAVCIKVSDCADLNFIIFNTGRVCRSYRSIDPEMLFRPLYKTDLPFIRDRIVKLESRIRTHIMNF